jgi:hypothetical protein
MPNQCENMSIENMFIECKIINDHEIKIENNIFFHEETDVPEFVEKFAGIIISKMFIKVKQFIENITI